MDCIVQLHILTGYYLHKHNRRIASVISVCEDWVYYAYGFTGPRTQQTLKGFLRDHERVSQKALRQTHRHWTGGYFVSVLSPGKRTEES